MDDPWANAWGEPAKPIVEPAIASAASWVAPITRIITHDDQEADISWPTGADLHWSDNSTTDSSLWGSEPTLTTAWEPQPSVYEGISLGKLSRSDSDSETTDLPSPGGPQSLPTLNVHDLAAAEPLETASHNEPQTPISRPLTPKSISPAPDSPDAFGTFEAAPESGAGSWSAPRPTLSIPSADGDPWGASWEPADSSVVKPADEPADEWEAARKFKERQDRHLPPELLSSILDRFEELSCEIWPEEDSKPASSVFTVAPLSLEDIGLTSIMNRLVPDNLTLPPQVQSCKSFTSKQISEALRLTRHLPLTRKSPMALYMASKGSTSWEASVKARPQLTQEDLTPPGWKLVEKVEPTPVDDGKKAAGGLLSFFGRKPTKSTSDNMNPGRSTPPSRPPSRSGSPNPIQTGGSSPRGSVDSTKSASGVHRGAIPSPIALSFSSTKTPDPNPMATPEANTGDQIELPSDPVPPSAVSRFFGRFSRTAKTTSSQPLSNPRNSLALSQDNLEFLSDVVPSAQDHVDHKTQLDALTDMIGSSPLPGTLPPPLAPPPRHQRSRQPSSSLGSTIISPSKSDDDDIMSLFNPSSPYQQSPVPDLLAANPSNKDFGTNSPPLPSVIQPLPVKSTTPLAGSNDANANPVDDGWPSFDFLPPATSKPQTHVPPAKRKIAAIMSQTPSAPAPTIPQGPTFHLPGNSPFTNPQRSGNSSTPAVPFLPPPPSSRSQTPHSLTHPVSATKSTLEDDDDDFSDFLSSPSQGTPLPPLFGSTVSSVFPEQPNRTISQNALNDFDAFLKPAKVPSPPQPPTKPPHFSSRSPPTKSYPLNSERTAPPPQQNPGRRVSRAADHSRTLSLLETAASRGRWLEPPSPLPEALPPPGASTHSFDHDIFSSPSTMQAQQAKSMPSSAPLAAPLAPPRTVGAAQPGPPSNGKFLQPVPTMRPTPIPPAPAGSSTVTKTGGLSAQDLSFFEGL